MSYSSWKEFSQYLESIIDALLADTLFESYASRSSEIFCENTEYFDDVITDFVGFSAYEFNHKYPFRSYSLSFFKSIFLSEITFCPTASQIPFFDLLDPCCQHFTRGCFSLYSNSIWHRPYLQSAIEELVSDLSELLAPCLYELFSDSLPFGLKVDRFYAESSSLKTSQRVHFDCFIVETFKTSFFYVVQRYPMSIYLVGQAIFHWHHRHLELLARVSLHFRDIFNESFSSLTSLIPQIKLSGDNHNFNRRSYVLSVSTRQQQDHLICYKPRSLANDLFFYNICRDIFSKCVDSLLSLPVPYNYGSYGFTEFISSPHGSEQSSYSTIRRDGMWLFILWIFGFTDCTHENFVFNGEHHSLIDFETAFTGFFSFLKTPLNDKQFSGRSLLSLSCPRTNFLPYWNVAVDDRVEVDVSCLGHSLSNQSLYSSLWLNVNSDYMIYRSSSSAESSIVKPTPCLSDSFISLSDYINLVVDGFDHAHSSLSPYFQELLETLTKYDRLSSRFIFRDTASYSRFFYDLCSPSSLTSPDSFFTTLNKLDRSILDHPRNKFIAWITSQEKIQLFNLDVPYFSTDIHGNRLFSCFGVFDEFCLIFTGGKSFVSLILESSGLSSLQPLFIESSLYSFKSTSFYAFSYSPLRGFNSFKYQSYIQLWFNAFEASLLEDYSNLEPLLLTFRSGLSRKDVQIENCSYDFLSGTLGILYASRVAHIMSPELVTQQSLSLAEDLFSRSVECYLPLNSLSPLTCGLSDLGGFIYGIQLAHHVDPGFDYQHLFSTSLFFNENSLDLLRRSDRVCPDLFSGLAGSVVAFLSLKPSIDNCYFESLIGLLLSYQSDDGFYYCTREDSSKLPLGIAHGVHGVLLSLLHVYTYTKSDLVLSSIHRLISAYKLTDLCTLDSFKQDMSWCSGLSGHLVTLRYLSTILPEYTFDEYRISQFILSHLNPSLYGDLSFCCGQSGILASLLYVDYFFTDEYSGLMRDLIQELHASIFDRFSSRFQESHYFLFKQDLLNGFSILPFFECCDTFSIRYLESILLFRGLP